MYFTVDISQQRTNKYGSENQNLRHRYFIKALWAILTCSQAKNRSSTSASSNFRLPGRPPSAAIVTVRWGNNRSLKRWRSRERGTTLKWGRNQSEEGKARWGPMELRTQLTGPAQSLVLALLLTDYGCGIRQTASFLRSSLRSQLVNEIWRGIQRNHVRTGPFERP